MDANDNLSAEASGEGEPAVAAAPSQEGSARPADEPGAAGPEREATPEGSQADSGTSGEDQAKAEDTADEGHAEEEAPADDETQADREAGGEEGGAREVAEEPPAPRPVPPELLVAPPRRRHHVAPALIAIERVLEDTTFRIRSEEGELSLLATDIARLGQLHPVDLRLVPPDRFQVICGFRRVAALRFLQRDKVLARLHTDLSDEDALLMALASAIHAAPVERDQLEAVKERLDDEGRLSAAARDMLEKALATESLLAPEGPEQEIDADELALDVTARLGAINQDLSLLADVFSSLDEARKKELIEQLRYSADLVAFLEGR